ncbi:hypothetical protein B0H10DRAFT_2227200 [Mycena sp. CBHHK59/15]|nr:hypothetical protein B0H10DRAFT_2227200 [Mycena sp. CBHHK59/15]
MGSLSSSGSAEDMEESHHAQGLLPVFKRGHAHNRSLLLPDTLSPCSSSRSAHGFQADGRVGFLVCVNVDQRGRYFLVPMLGGGHVRCRSIGSLFEASPCVRVEKKKHTMFQEDDEGPNKARIVAKASIASTSAACTRLWPRIPPHPRACPNRLRPPNSPADAPQPHANLSVPCSKPTHCAPFLHAGRPRRYPSTPPAPDYGRTSCLTFMPAQIANAHPIRLRPLPGRTQIRVRPARRYKNMNSLRYHYQHSGDHGAVALGLLVCGVHGCLQRNANTTVPAVTPMPVYAWGSTLLPHIQAVTSAG